MQGQELGGTNWYSGGYRTAARRREENCRPQGEHDRDQKLGQASLLAAGCISARGYIQAAALVFDLSAAGAGRMRRGGIFPGVITEQMILLHVDVPVRHHAETRLASHPEHHGEEENHDETTADEGKLKEHGCCAFL